MLTVTYAECHIKAPYAECHYAECRYAECRGASMLYQKCVILAYQFTASNLIIFSKGVVVFVADDAARAKEAEAILKNFGHSNVQVSML
jgi:hypothetical protein